MLSLSLSLNSRGAFKLLCATRVCVRVCLSRMCALFTCLRAEVKSDDERELEREKVDIFPVAAGGCDTYNTRKSGVCLKKKCER